MEKRQRRNGDQKDRKDKSTAGNLTLLLSVFIALITVTPLQKRSDAQLVS
jgi:hypothetical protein